MNQSNPFLLNIVRRLTKDPYEAVFLYDILANPDEITTRAVYADWLEDRGDPRGEYIHVRLEQARAACEPKRWDEIQRRKETLRNEYEIDPLWLGFVMREAITGRVSRIEDYGFYVDLGNGLEGLAHITDMAW